MFHFMQSVDAMISSFFKTFDYVDKSIEYSYISKSNLEGNREEVVFLVFEYFLLHETYLVSCFQKSLRFIKYKIPKKNLPCLQYP